MDSSPSPQPVCTVSVWLLTLLWCPSQLNLAYNALCGLDPTTGEGTYTKEGITAIADALRVSPSMTWLDVRHNLIGEEGKAALREAIEGRSGFEVLLGA